MKTWLRYSIIICLALFTVAAGPALDFSIHGLSPEGIKAENGSTVEVFGSPSFGRLAVSYKAEPGQYEIELMENTIGMIKSWKEVEPAEVRFVVEEGRIDAFIIPGKYVAGGVDAVPYMPSGMHFIITNHPEYDFRMKVGNLFVRMQGWFYNFDEFNIRVTNAIKNPHAFIRTNDPEYLVRKVEEYEVLFSETQMKMAAIEKENRKLTASVAMLLKDMDALQEAIVILHNRGFFGNIQIPDENAVARAIAIKKEKPELTAKEVSAMLKAEGLKLSSNEIFLVFLTFFGEI